MSIVISYLDVQLIVTSVIIGAICGTSVTWIAIKLQLKRKNSQGKEANLVETPNLNIIDQVNKQLVPFLPEFLSKYNPKDARFLGSPIDLVIFDGLDEGDLRRIVFVETKVSSTELNENEQKIRDIIFSKRVDWEVLKKD
ncbi:MAG: Holliday junction resolvase-like protein [Conexivisphaerales archaeon]